MISRGIFKKNILLQATERAGPTGPKQGISVMAKERKGEIIIQQDMGYFSLTQTCQLVRRNLDFPLRNQSYFPGLSSLGTSVARASSYLMDAAL